jgi:hypothetical protein
MDAAAYWAQIRALRLEADARGVFSAASSPQARRHALAMKLGLLDQPITPEVLDPLLAAWQESRYRRANRGAFARVCGGSLRIELRGPV